MQLVRDFHGLNQTDAANKIGVSQSFVCAVEAGRRVATLNVLQRYAAAFSLTLDELTEFVEHVLPLPSPPHEMPIYKPDKLSCMILWADKQLDADAHKEFPNGFSKQSKQRAKKTNRA